MEIVSTIVPIFAIVILGWAARKKGFMPPEFLGPANRLIYHIAIPAMVFRAISRSSLGAQFHGPVLFVTLAAAVLAYLAGWLFSRWGHMPSGRAGAFVQSAGHGNLGYIGLSVAFYYLGDDGLVRASIIAGFLMILQNMLSVVALQANAAPKKAGGNRSGTIARNLFGNPIILAAVAGIAASALAIPIPLVIERSLDMLSGLAPPTALLLIGAALSVSVMRKHMRPVAGVVALKLLFLPAVGLLVYHVLGLKAGDYLPGLILLASPTATVTYVMAKEMGGDTDFAVAAISASTLFSAATITLWLAVAGRIG